MKACSLLVLVEASQASLAEESFLAGHLGALAQGDKAVRGGDFGEVRQGEGGSAGRVQTVLGLHVGAGEGHISFKEGPA